MISKIQLGSEGPLISRIALGTVKVGRNTNVKYPSEFELPSDDAVIRLLERARNLGVNLIDTAPAYGISESRLGKLLPGARHDWIICTKAGENYLNDQSSFDFSKAAITQSVHQSLERLGTDYLDIVLIHANNDDLNVINETDAIETLQHLKAQGHIRQIGISSKSVEAGLLACDTCDVLMLTLNSEDQSQLPVIEKARSMNRGVLLKKALASGFAKPSESLAFALQQPGVHSAVIGTLNEDHLADNINIANRLDPA